MLATESVVSPVDKVVTTEEKRKPLFDSEHEGLAFISFGRNKLVLPVARRGDHVEWLLELFDAFTEVPYMEQHLKEKDEDDRGSLVLFAPTFDRLPKRAQAAIDRNKIATGTLLDGSADYATFNRSTLEKRSLDRVLGLPVCKSEEFQASVNYLLNLPKPDVLEENPPILLFCDFDLFYITSNGNWGSGGGKRQEKHEYVLVTAESMQIAVLSAML